MPKKPERILIFFLTEEDERRAAEITLAGVIDSKIAKADYAEITAENGGNLEVRSWLEY